MKKLVLSLAIVFLSACNDNKTAQSGQSEAVAIDTTSSDHLEKVPMDSASRVEMDSTAVDNASKSGASSITPRKDSVSAR